MKDSNLCTIFKAASLLLFIQRDLLNILVSESRLRHMELKKIKILREFYTEDILVVSNQMKSTRKEMVV